jgi:hypothetical protein
MANKNIYVGWDSREDIAYQVCEHSIYKRTYREFTQVVPLKQHELREQNIYTRDVDKLASTEFTFTRFLVPYLNDYQGWAIFCDCDMVFLVDADEINDPHTTGKYLHRFSWLDDSEIGELSHEYNWLVGWYKEPKDGSPKVLHYTEGGPWFGNMRNCEYGDTWKKEVINLYSS